MPSKPTSSLLIALPLLLLSLSCGPDGQPVAEVRTPSDAQVELAYPGEASLSLGWKPIRALEGSQGAPRIFVHLLDDDGKVLRTFDHPVPFPWRLGEEQEHRVTLWQSALVAPLEPGTYELSFGLYEGERRWALETDAAQIADEEYLLGRVEVTAPPQEPLELSFDGFHLDERSGDRQILIRRWLGGDAGQIELAAFDGALELVVGLRIPDPGRIPLRLVLDEGAEEAMVRIASGCAEKTVSLSGSGLHDVKLRLRPESPETSCTVTLETNFLLLDVDSLEKRSVSLERLTWRRLEPGGPAAP